MGPREGHAVEVLWPGAVLGVREVPAGSRNRQHPGERPEHTKKQALLQTPETCGAVIGVREVRREVQSCLGYSTRFGGARGTLKAFG